MSVKNQIVYLNLEDILPNRYQPRIKFDDKSINELANSIKEHGVLQPIIVRKISNKYEIIAGERRFKASKLAGLNTIPAIITEYTNKESAEIALIENLQREELTPIEKAASYKKILDISNLTQEDLAKKVGKTQSSISNTLRLLTLSDKVQEALLDSKISERHARSLLKLKNENDQNLMLQKTIDDKITVRNLDKEIEKLQNPIKLSVSPIESIFEKPLKPEEKENIMKEEFLDIDIEDIKIPTIPIQEPTTNKFVNTNQTAESSVFPENIEPVLSMPKDDIVIFPNTEQNELIPEIPNNYETPKSPIESNKKFFSFTQPEEQNESPTLQNEELNETQDFYSKLAATSENILEETIPNKESTFESITQNTNIENTQAPYLKALREYRELTNTLKKTNLDIETDELDLGTEYQITIKIKIE